MTDSVIKLFDRFTFSTTEGHERLYSPWFQVPERCLRAEIRHECHAYNNGDVEVIVETSMDRTSVFKLSTDTLNAVEVLQQVILGGISPYIRASLGAPIAGTKPKMVLSVIVLFRTAQ